MTVYVVVVTQSCAVTAIDEVQDKLVASVTTAVAVLSARVYVSVGT